MLLPIHVYILPASMPYRIQTRAVHWLVKSSNSPSYVEASINEFGEDWSLSLQAHRPRRPATHIFVIVLSHEKPLQAFGAVSTTVAFIQIHESVYASLEQPVSPPLRELAPVTGGRLRSLYRLQVTLFQAVCTEQGLYRSTLSDFHG